MNDSIKIILRSRSSDCLPLIQQQKTRVVIKRFPTDYHLLLLFNMIQYKMIAQTQKSHLSFVEQSFFSEKHNECDRCWF